MWQGTNLDKKEKGKKCQPNIFVGFFSTCFFQVIRHYELIRGLVYAPYRIFNVYLMMFK